MPGDTLDGDAVCNRASLVHAQSQRLVSSWLPPRGYNETAAKKTENQLDREELEAFSPVPELLGLGAPILQHGSGRDEVGNNHIDEMLRTRIMGKGAGVKNGKHPGVFTGPSNRPSKRKQPDEPDDAISNDEEGRTAIRRKSDKATAATSKFETQKDPLLQEVFSQAVAEVKPLMFDAEATKKVSRSYLDEVLSKRSGRKKKQRTKTTQRE